MSLAGLVRPDPIPPNLGRRYTSQRYREPTAARCRQATPLDAYDRPATTKPAGCGRAACELNRTASQRRQDDHQSDKSSDQGRLLSHAGHTRWLLPGSLPCSRNSRVTSACRQLRTAPSWPLPEGFANRLANGRRANRFSPGENFRPSHPPHRGQLLYAEAHENLGTSRDCRSGPDRRFNRSGPARTWLGSRSDRDWSTGEYAPDGISSRGGHLDDHRFGTWCGRSGFGAGLHAG